MSFKGIILNRELIETTLNNYDENIKVESEKKDKYVEYRIFNPPQDIALLHVYYLNNGSTTLTYKVGRNHALSLKLAEHIKEKCAVGSNITKPSLSISNVTEEKIS